MTAPTDTYWDEPQSDEHRRITAERPVLGAVLTTTPAFDTAGEISKLINESHWYLPAHALIFAAAMRLHGLGRPITPITVAQELQRTADLARCGGHAYLHRLAREAHPGPAAPWYAEQIRGMAKLDLFGTVAQRAVQRAQQADPEDPDTVISAHLADVEALLDEEAARDDDFGLFADDIDEHIEWLDDEQPEPFAVTGFADLDAVMKIEPGQLILAAGRPGMGKSAFALCVAVAAARAGRPVLFHSLEMGKREVTNRILAAKSRVAFHHLRERRKGLTDDDWKALAHHTPDLRSLPLWMDYNPRVTPARIRSRAKTVAKQAGTEPLIVLDYAQLVGADHAGSKLQQSRYEAMTEISRELKLIPRELGCAMLALAQLNRGPEQRQDKRPMPSDLRDTGGFEQDADAIILLHREDYYDKSSKRSGESDLILAKHRNGTTPDITVAHQFHYSRFVDLGRDVPA